MTSPKPLEIEQKTIQTEAEQIGLRSDLINLNEVVDIITAAVFTGMLKGEKPVSVCLIAEAESAKSQALLLFKNLESLKFLSDLTSKGISSFKSDIESGKIRHLVILDLVRVVSHGRNVTDRTIQLLASLMEEGQADLADGGGLESWKGLPNVGVLMSITPSYFRSKRGSWRSSGFLSRFLPVYYDYTADTITEVHDRIMNGHRLPDAAKVKAPAPKRIAIESDEAEAIMILARDKTGLDSPYGFRYHRQIRTLCLARALVCGRRKVSPEDVMTIARWSRFFQTNKPIKL